VAVGATIGVLVDEIEDIGKVKAEDFAEAASPQKVTPASPAPTTPAKTESKAQASSIGHSIITMNSALEHGVRMSPSSCFWANTYGIELS
jgi:pyruvate/2-oxoglutarate dehydrogenase complex dihydrolipoamide acyltransferase (E2) component